MAVIERNRWLVPLAGALMLLVSAPFLRISSPGEFAAFAAFVILGQLLEVRLANGTTATLGIAPAIAYALLGHSVSEIIFVYAAGSIAASLVGLIRRRAPVADDLILRGIVTAAAAAIYGGFVAADAGLRFGPEGARISAIGLGLALLAVVGVNAAVTALLDGRTQRIPWMPLFAATLRSTAALDVSAVSAGTLLALSFPVLGAWSLPLFLAPLVATHYSFRQLASIQRTYLQTVRALSKVPEMAGYTREGHSTRVASLSVEIGRALGAVDTTEIEYAALLHDIGRLSLPDPDPDAGADHPLELALVGAAIADESGHIPGVARIIRMQHEPHRRRGEDRADELPLGARIIKVASAYDGLTQPGGLGRTPWDALERLHLGTAYDYDPAVLQALVKVLEKRGEI